MYTALQGDWRAIIGDLTDDYARYSFGIIAISQHIDMAASSRRLTALSDMHDLQYGGDAGKWKIDFMAKVREVYESKLTIEHFICYSAFKSFEGKHPQVQSQMALDINSDFIQKDMNFDAFASKHAAFIATLGASKKMFVVEGATNPDKKCKDCGKDGHWNKNYPKCELHEKATTKCRSCKQVGHTSIRDPACPKHNPEHKNDDDKPEEGEAEEDKDKGKGAGVNLSQANYSAGDVQAMFDSIKSGRMRL